MTDRIYRGRPAAKSGEPAILNGVRTHQYTGTPVYCAIAVDIYLGQKSFEFEGWEYRVESADRSGWNDQNEHAGLWTMNLA